MNKADKDKVIAALEMNRIMARDENGNYTKEITAQVVVEALSIMRGLAEDTELLALFAASQKQLPLNAAISATSPQAAQTEAHGLESLFSEWFDSTPHGEPSPRETFEAGYQAGRAGSKP